MKNKHWKKINTAVELTSLLDVIFIVLMIVVCNQQINLTERQTELEQQTVRAEAMMQEAQEPPSRKCSLGTFRRSRS